MTTVDEIANIIRQVDGNNSLGAGALAEAIIERLPHIAARQPVGEVVADDDAYQRGYNDGYGEGYGQRATDSTQPVAWRGFCSDGVEFETDREHCEANPDYWQALYAAPPAHQAAQVDLGQFRKLASDWFRLSNDRYMERKDRKLLAMYDKGLKKCSRELLALIDSQTK